MCSVSWDENGVENYSLCPENELQRTLTANCIPCPKPSGLYAILVRLDEATRRHKCKKEKKSDLWRSVSSRLHNARLTPNTPCSCLHYALRTPQGRTLRGPRVVWNSVAPTIDFIWWRLCVDAANRRSERAASVDQVAGTKYTDPLRSLSL